MNCCQAWADAQTPGTDNEGYGQLLRHTLGRWSIGVDLPHIEFCPWCGAGIDDEQKPKPKKESQ